MSLLCFKFSSGFLWPLNTLQTPQPGRPHIIWSLPTCLPPHAPLTPPLLVPSWLTGLLSDPHICQYYSYLRAFTLAVCSFCLEYYFLNILYDYQLLIQFLAHMSAPLGPQPSPIVSYPVIRFYILSNICHHLKLQICMYCVG